MKKIEKMIHQIIRFRGKIEAFFVSIDEFASSNILQLTIEHVHADCNQIKNILDFNLNI